MDALHAVIISLTLAGALGVTALTITFVVRHEEHAGSRRASRRGLSRKVEYGIISTLLALFVAVWVVGYRQYVVMATPPPDSLDVYVIGKQWMWSFAYAQGGVSNRDLYVPVGKPVRLLLTSRDVIHSFFVPGMRIKQDAVPGRTTVAWFQARVAGTFPILCAEYCGLSHSRMRGSVVAVSLEEYARLQDSNFSPARPIHPTENLAAMGLRIAAERGCLRCHTVDGTPHLGPTWAGLYMSAIPLRDGTSVVADPAFLTRSMMDPTVEIHAGFEPIMPSYMGLLDAPEVAALLELMRSLEHTELSDSPVVPLPAAVDRAPALPMQADPRQPAPPSPGEED